MRQERVLAVMFYLRYYTSHTPHLNYTHAPRDSNRQIEGDNRTDDTTGQLSLIRDKFAKSGPLTTVFSLDCPVVSSVRLSPQIV
jgi:hypothetical protein